MRAALLVVAVAACSPDIVSGSYLCGDEQLCPSGYACNGADNTCVHPALAQPFACDPGDLHEPDEDAAHAFALPLSGCVTTVYRDRGCLDANDPANWSKVTTPGNCAAVGVHVTAAFPIAWEPLSLELWDIAANQKIAGDNACGSGVPGAGEDQTCLDHALENGKTYGIVVVPAGGGDCNGSCNYNRYFLSVQLGAP